MGKKIVLIEDDEILAKVIFTELTDAGFDVVQAFDGSAGLELVKKEVPDLVLLDLILPKKDGFAVLAELKKDPHPRTQSVPVIILTLLGEDVDIKRGMALGAVDYLVKSSHTTEEVIGKIKKFFAQT